MKVAIVEASHWHFPLYAPALHRQDVDVVAVSDRSDAAREKVVKEFGARAYADARELIASEDMDFAFLFGRHCEMPALAMALIERSIPFSIEKPGATCAADVARIRAAAADKDLYVAVPLVQRLGPLYSTLRDLMQRENASFTHSSWRFFAGPPARYPKAGNAWMLQPQLSGGGCLINLAPHFIDLALQLHGACDGDLRARLSARLHATSVEDYAMVSLRCIDGGTAQIETGYCFPDHAAKREYSFSVVGAAHYLRSRDDGVAIYRSGESQVEHRAFDADSDPLYAQYVTAVLEDLQNARAPLAGLADLEAIMHVIDAVHAQARSA